MPAIQRDMQAHLRRQLRSEQMARFVNALPGFRIATDLPEPMGRLLRELDRISDDAGRPRGSNGSVGNARPGRSCK